jgi:asparagine synthase (glutamine-hydrolysing)
VKVVLSGDGSDEVFGGYPWRHADFADLSMLYANRRLAALLGALGRGPLGAWLPQRVRAALPGYAGRDERYVRKLACFDEHGMQAILAAPYGAPVLAGWSDNVVQQHLDSGLTREEVARKLYTDVKTTMVSEMLTKVDRMTMAHGLEARVPFLDHRLVEWAFKLPGRYKVQRGQGKILVKKALERHLPAEILYRPKQGFNVPLKLWLRRELRDFVRDRLSSERIARRGFFRPAAVAGIVDAHFAGRIEASNRIYALLMLDLWAEHFIDRRAAFLPA